MNANLYTIDEERREAHRQELKRKLAETEVKKERLRELEDIAKRLDADSDAAAAEHSAAADELQSELDKLDEQHVDALLIGKTSTSKAMQRRGEILQALADLNTQLEIRCEANKHSKRPIASQIHAITMDIALTAADKSKLVDLASAKTRQARLLNSLQMKAAQIALAEAKRCVDVNSHNLSLAEDHIRRRIPAAEDKAIATVKLEDWRFVYNACQAEIQRLKKNDEAIQATALAE